MKISIITPSFNGWRYVRRAADSIRTQGPSLWEWIIIDGGSTDGSVEFFNTIPDPRVKCVCEPDRGQSHAINKGLAMATGDVVAWLNTDDVYAPGALDAVAGAFEAHPSAQWLVGRYEIIDADGRVIRPAVVMAVISTTSKRM